MYPKQGNLCIIFDNLTYLGN